ncbi:MAG TPA: hypothetical protein PLV72_02270 [Candidatus Magasanikbacteria bacterium]|nr:hypothetical protein [Candidatus Magasanikbacteria bacterium]
MKFIFWRIFSIFSIVLFLFSGSDAIAIEGSTSTVSATPTNAGKIEYVLFHSQYCPHCKAEITFIDKKLRPKYGDDVEFKLYEVNEGANRDLFSQYSYFFHTDNTSVPVAFIDGEVVHGFDSEKKVGVKIIQIIEKAIAERCGEVNIATTTTEKISIPVLGEIDPKSFSLPILTVVVGLLDGFNPCAMWTLLFLISLLLGMGNRRRMWLLGGLFILSAGLVYFIFMAAWLKFILFIGMVLAVRIVIGTVAVGVGGKNLYDWWISRKADGVVCKVSKNENTSKVFAKIKDIVYRRSLIWSITGIVLLGFSVNLVEMACSAGFPAVYTQVLALSGIPAWQKYLHMVGYIIFYMLDDMIVFVVAMVTLRPTMLGGRFGKYSNLIGGVLIFILGLLLIFRPEWLMLS